MKKTSVANLIMAALVLLTTNGCSLFAPWTQTVSVNSGPSGAEVIVDNKFKGYTPCNIDVTCKGATITVRKDGYVSQNHTIGRSLGTCGIMDLVGTFFFIVPVVGLIAPGAYTLDERTVNFNMPKASE